MPEHALDILDYSTYFDNYKAGGTCVMLKNKVTLLPKVESKKGG